MEASSLLGKASASIGFLEGLKSVFKGQSNAGLSALLNDGVRFKIECIRSTPLQLYSSLLVFAPKNSKVRALFEARIPSSISLKPKTDSDWNACLQTFDAQNPVMMATFSHDSTLYEFGGLIPANVYKFGIHPDVTRDLLQWGLERDLDILYMTGNSFRQSLGLGRYESVV
ncbi:hypothetical protein J3459_014763 [Metarhizium acridum]|nr:hypothetical protein J3459_014763 [Metarhizium acridum]